MPLDSRYLRITVLGYSLFASLLLSAPSLTVAGTKDHFSDGKGGADRPLQQVVRHTRKPGPITVAIPVAYVFGMGQDKARNYCSPSIRAINSSNVQVEELVVGVEYSKIGTNTDVGSTVTRFSSVKVGHQDTHYFYQLGTSDCRGLEGRGFVVRCVYTNGEDCRNDVQMIGYGLIPLRLRNR